MKEKGDYPSFNQLYDAYLRALRQYEPRYPLVEETADAQIVGRTRSEPTKEDVAWLAEMKIKWESDDEDCRATK